MADPGPAPALALSDAARILGGYRWMEQRVFELTGAWAADAADPRVQLHLDEVSIQHAWHAELFADRLPVLDGVDPDALSVPDGPVAGPLLGALGHLGDSAADADPLTDVRRLAGLYRVVLPRLLVTYDRHLGAAVPATDGPVIRVLRLVLRDESESWLAGESQLQALVVTPEAVAAAGQVQTELEALCIEAPQGLAAWPPERSPFF